MVRQMIMGNQAIALGALKAGVNLVAGYPGTPSSEIIEFIAKYKEQTGTYVEWSVNEKAAVEVAAGASYAGSRTMVTMKQVGLNVASDPVMCLSYVGVKGGMVIVSADDPGPISSQTEQDTRKFASFSKLPCFDPSTPLEAFEMVQAAFELSEKYNTPVLLRPTTRVDHAYESMEVPALEACRKNGEFEKDTNRWVIFPRSSYMNHKRIFKRNMNVLPEEFSKSKWNFIKTCEGREGALDASSFDIAFAAGGISYNYLMESLSLLNLKGVKVLKIGTPYPFPENLALSFMKENSSIVVFEELDPVIEENLIYLCGKENVSCKIHGKIDGFVEEAGELSVEKVSEVLMDLYSRKMKEAHLLEDESKLDKLILESSKLNGSKLNDSKMKSSPLDNSDLESSKLNKVSQVPALPVRPPVLCAGCPHRASFYAVKMAMKNLKTVYCGDIGCYTLGNAQPLDMTDTCLCMGADITMAQGFYHTEKDRHCFSFIGDSTFFASGITGVVNAVYNQAKQTICILDNSTTAMTGHQPHPGTGRTMMGEIVEKISIKKILEAIGVNPVIEVNPFDLEEAIESVKKADAADGVSAIIFKSPCISIASKLGFKAQKPKVVDREKCIGCKKCIKELGCPALSLSKEKTSKGKEIVAIDASLCTGCSLCQNVCPVKAIGE